MLSVLLDFSQQFCCQLPSFVGSALDLSLSRRRRFTFEHLCAQFHRSVADRRVHADWKVAITVQPTQKFSLCLQTKQRFGIVYRLEKRFCALVIRADLESNDSLTACWKKNLVGKNLQKELSTFEADSGSHCRKTQTLQSRAS